MPKSAPLSIIKKYMMTFFKVSKSLYNDVKSMMCDVAYLAGDNIYKVNHFGLFFREAHKSTGKINQITVK